jgi:CPA1 family monovalent cation:H+ antiporter
MSQKTRESVDLFWELVDNILNALLFVLIGLEMITLDFKTHYLLLGILIIPVVLLSRWLSIAPFIHFFKKEKAYHKDLTIFLNWGGLRGGIAIALALSLPPSPYRDMILTITYLVVVFSILVQGLTLKRIYFTLRRKYQKT